MEDELVLPSDLEGSQQQLDRVSEAEEQDEDALFDQYEH